MVIGSICTNDPTFFSKIVAAMNDFTSEDCSGGGVNETQAGMAVTTKISKECIIVITREEQVKCVSPHLTRKVFIWPQESWL